MSKPDDLMRYYFKAGPVLDFKEQVREMDRLRRIEGKSGECVKWKTSTVRPK